MSETCKKKKTLLSWSSGKDSAWTLHVLRQQPDVETVGLFCTINQEFDRVAMHSVRMALVLEQARCLGLLVSFVPIPYPCTNADYEKIMADFIKQAEDDGIEQIAFGDLFLEDIRQYREDAMQGSSINAIFPLWGKPTEALSREMVQAGLRAVITCVDPKKLSGSFAGKIYDESFLNMLPAGIDPCGEYGEFHSFVFDGPMFHRAVKFNPGETVKRDGFIFADLLPD